MFFSWGARSEIATVGPAGHFACSACNTDSSFTRLVSYRVRHAYWIFRWVTGRKLHLICDTCGAESRDDTAANAPEVTKAIPAFDRRGWIAAPVLLVALIVIGSIASSANDADNRRFVSQPKVGDLYEVDLARGVPHPEAPTMYTALRIAAIRGDQIDLQIANRYYEKRRGVDRDLDRGTTNQPGYFGSARMVASRAGLAKMLNDGVTVDIRRP